MFFDAGIGVLVHFDDEDDENDCEQDCQCWGDGNGEEYPVEDGVDKDWGEEDHQFVFRCVADAEMNFCIIIAHEYGEGIMTWHPVNISHHSHQLLSYHKSE